MRPFRIKSQIYPQHYLNIINRYKSTIFALCSGQGKCGVSVIRVSGPETLTVLKSMAGFKDPPKPRYAFLKGIKYPNSKELIDRGLVIWFPGPKSFTGEDSCEFQVHGGPSVVRSILNGLVQVKTCRLAEPGEFTKRAFYNGKLDLTQVEGLSDLLQAETELQRKQAFLQTEGHLGKLYASWRKELLYIVAYLEADIDFGETEDCDSITLQGIFKNVERLKGSISEHLNNGKKGEILRLGVKTVILGEPNVGKSSLLNFFCDRPAAIVTPIEGTTRDVVEVKLDIGNYAVNLLDTAGLRYKTTDAIEQIGVKKAREEFATANFSIILLNALDIYIWKLKNPHLKFARYIEEHIKKLNLFNIKNYNFSNPDIIDNKYVLFVVNKIDIIPYDYRNFDDKLLEISCANKEGMEEFLKEISKILKDICGEPTEEHPNMSQARHRQHLTDCLNNLDKFLIKYKNNSLDLDVVSLAEYLRRALRDLGKLVGVVNVEELLNVIFKDFCIGK